MIVDVNGNPIVTEAPQKRRFEAAKMDRLTFDWSTAPITDNESLKGDWAALVARSRELYRNNPFANGFVIDAVKNVIGPKGITLQNKAVGNDGKLDKKDNTTIEKAWNDWGKKGTCDVSGRYSFRTALQLTVRQSARDGEYIIRKRRGNFNRYGFAIQFINPELLDYQLNEVRKNGNIIFMGVELNEYLKPVQYWFKKNNGPHYHPTTSRTYVVIPANEIIHGFISLEPNQVRGVPWMASVMKRLNMLDGYEEAELVAARIASAKMGFFETPTGEEYTGDEIDEFGNIISEVEPGIMEQLPAGVKFNSYDPQHPTTAFGQFVKDNLRGCASGLGISYVGLAKDLEGVNYSSIRAGVLSERDLWKDLQAWTIESILEDIFPEWLETSLRQGAIKDENGNMLPLSKFDKFNAAEWLPRTWPWVDPLKDVQAENFEINTLKIKTRTQAAAERGRDFEDVIKKQSEEAQIAESYGIVLNIEEQQAVENDDKDD